MRFLSKWGESPKWGRGWSGDLRRQVPNPSLNVDQLVSVVSDRQRQECLRKVSLVSTAWVGRCQRYLFSTITFSHEGSVRNWCSRTRDSSDRLSKHVRILFLNRADFYWPFVIAKDVKNAPPCFTSFQNLQELGVNDLDPSLASLDVLTPILSSFASSLKRLSWSPGRTPWTVITTLVDPLPNPADLDLSYYSLHRTKRITSPPLPRIKLSYNAKVVDSLEFKHFKFQELSVATLSIPHSPSFFKYCRTHLRVLDLRATRIDRDCEPLRALLGACHTLEVVAFTFNKGFGELLGSISSDFVSLIHMCGPCPRIPSAISKSFCSWPAGHFEDYISELEHVTLPECRAMGVSFCEIGRNFSNRHPGLKTRVRISSWLTDAEAQVVEDVDIPFFQAEIEKVAGGWVTFELAPQQQTSSF